MKRLTFISCFVALAILAGCSGRPDGVMSNHKMALLLADMHRGEGVVEMNRRVFNSDSSKIALKEAIYRRHNVSQEVVDSSLSWYGHHMDEYMKVYTEVIDILQQEIDNTDAVAARIQLSAVGDSADTWSFSPRYILNSHSPVPELSVYLTPDENWENGDNYTLNFRVMNSTMPFKSVLGVEYEGGQVEWVENEVPENGKYSFLFVSDSTKNIKSVYSSILVSPSIHETVFIDSLSLIRTRVDRNIYGRRHSQKKLMPKHSETDVSQSINKPDSLTEIN